MARITRASLSAGPRNHPGEEFEDEPMLDELISATDQPKTPRSLEQILEISGFKDRASIYQSNILTEFEKQLTCLRNGVSAQSIIIQAVAGAGKSTLTIGAAKLIPANIKSLFLAFNKSIADELKDRLPSHVNARTINSLGQGILRRYLARIGVPEFQVKGNRTYFVMKSFMSYGDIERYGNDITHLTRYCKAMGVAPVGATDARGVDGRVADDDTLDWICRAFGHVVDPIMKTSVYDRTRRVLLDSFSDANIIRTSMIDYDDQKWLPVVKWPGGDSMVPKMADVVMVDEVQDLNRTDIELCIMAAGKTGMFMCVGDRNQSIYKFKGADTKSMERVKNRLNAIELPMSITYRCSKAVTRHAKKLVPQIEAAPNAPEGECYEMTDVVPEFFTPGDLVMARTNALTIKFAYKLLGAGIPCLVKGKTIGKGLTVLIDELVAKKVWVDNPHKRGKKMPIRSVEGVILPVLRTKLNKWENDNIEIIESEDNDQERKNTITDTADAIRMFMEKASDVQEVVDNINAMFTDTKSDNIVTVTTVHKAKGLEAERAFLYGVDQMNPKWMADADEEQETNLEYVARTRAKTVFGYMHQKAWLDDD